MQLLQYIPFFSVFLIAVLGLGSFALALMVWRRRRMALCAQSGWAQSLGRLLIPLGLIGSLAIILSLSLRTFFPRRGELFLRDTLVVRADTDRGQPSLSSKPELAKGDVLLTFEKAGGKSERKRLEILAKKLEAEREVLADSPLELDPVLVREKQELETERRSLSQRLSTLQIEQQRMLQQARNEILDKKVLQDELRVQLGDYEGRIKKTESELVYTRLRLEAAKGMRKEEVVSKLAYAEQIRDIGVLEAEARRLETEQSVKRSELAALIQGTETLEDMLEQHTALFDKSIEDVRASLVVLGKDRERHQKLMDREQARLGRQRAGALRALDLQRADCEAQLVANLARTRVICPTGGELLYAHQSPSAAQSGEPIAMFGQEGSVRARFRLSQGESHRLESAGTIPLLATSHELLTTRLSGHFVASTPVVNEPGIVLAEFTCKASPSQLRYLSRGLNIDVRLLWSPPLLSDPLLLLGALLLLVSMLPSLLPRFRRMPQLVIALKPSVPVPGVQACDRRAKSG